MGLGVVGRERGRGLGPADGLEEDDAKVAHIFGEEIQERLFAITNHVEDGGAVDVEPVLRRHQHLGRIHTPQGLVATVHDSYGR